MVGKQKLHLVPHLGRNGASSNNQAHLTDKSSAEQSLSVALRASSLVTRPETKTGGSYGRHDARKAPKNCSGCIWRNFFHHLPAQPHLALGMAMAQWSW